MPAESTKPTGRTYLTARHVRDRYGVADMTLWRWLRDPALGFPQPLRIRGRRYWDAELLEEWDARRAGASVAPAGDTISTDRDSAASDFGQLARSSEGRELLLRLAQVAGKGEGTANNSTATDPILGRTVAPNGIAGVVDPSGRSTHDPASPSGRNPKLPTTGRPGRRLPR